MNYLGKLIFSIGLVVSSLFGYHQPTVPNQSFGDFNPVAGQTYRLQSSISTTQNTITLTSFKEPISGIKFTMAYANTNILYGTLDPQNNSTKEFVSFTGITQNSDGTALLTGVSRGLGFSYPYTASTTLASSHSGQSIFILSNPPQLTNQYLNKTNAGNVTGLITFTDPPILTNAGTSTLQAASIGYANGLVLGSTPVIVNAGGTGLTTLPLNMFLVGNGTSNVTSTSTPTVTGIVATSTTFNSSFAGNVTFNGGINASSTTNNFIASSTQYIENVGVINATSTITINGVKISTTTTLSTGYSGVLSAGASTTLLTVVIPANTLTVSNSLQGFAKFAYTGGSTGACDIDIGNGSATTTVAYSVLAQASFARFNIFATSTNAINISSEYTLYTAGENSISLAVNSPLYGTFSKAYAPTSNIYIAFIGQDGGSGRCQLVGRTIQVIN